MSILIQVLRARFLFVIWLTTLGWEAIAAVMSATICDCEFLRGDFRNVKAQRRIDRDLKC
jgi:hypothetical protein